MDLIGDLVCETGWISRPVKPGLNNWNLLEPERSASAHSHRLSDPATQGVDAIVVTGNPVLRKNSMPQPSSQRSLIEPQLEQTGPEKLEPKGTRGKGRLADKYLAGLLDSDGSIYLIWRGTEQQQKVHVGVSFSQNTPDQSFMQLIASSLTPPSLAQSWGSVQTNTSKEGIHQWVVAGSKATSVLMRLKKFLVLKRALADCAIDMNGKLMDVTVAKQRFDAARGASPMPKHPTRKWAAGYIDGNGSFNVRVQRGLAGLVYLEICDEAFERVGVDLLQKAYGGSIQEFTTAYGTTIARWTLTMDAAKVRSMFESGKTGLAKHMVLKTDQVYFLLGCAKLGHFRDGERIKAGLEQLRSQPHRLSGPGVRVAHLLKTVRDIPLFIGPGAIERKRQWEQAQPVSTDYEGSREP